MAVCWKTQHYFPAIKESYKRKTERIFRSQRYSGTSPGHLSYRISLIVQPRFEVLGSLLMPFSSSHIPRACG
ncbi:hypothetical protein VTN00DRAFT_5375 [Thermoascus crustaceus]|uniref:uncharacterized protein n=1 Tax=Thermoascus crustaceus TaxID=5088 RepID=UPI00374335C7